MAYLYRHIRLDKNEPFYIGIGSDAKYKRAYSAKQRTKHWKFVASSAPYDVEIVLDNLTWEEACEKEKEFIKLYGRHDKGEGPLCNYTDGGEGAYGRVPSLDTRKKISQSVSGPKHGMYGKTHTLEARRKISAAGRKKCSDEIKEKIRANTIGKAKTVTIKRLEFLDRIKSGETKLARKVINKVTGEIFVTIKLAAQSQGLDPRNLSRKLNGTRRNNTDFKLLL